jgi:hypothetical protein
VGPGFLFLIDSPVAPYWPSGPFPSRLLRPRGEFEKQAVTRTLYHEGTDLSTKLLSSTRDANGPPGGGDSGKDGGTPLSETRATVMSQH